MQYKCDDCEKLFTTKKKRSDHQRRMHPATEQPNAPEKLVIKTPPKKEKKEAATGYHCIDCGKTVTKDEDRCPGCGAHLDWSQL